MYAVKNNTFSLYPGLIVYYVMISIPVLLTTIGLIYMCRTNCNLREKCCKCCLDLEKKDVNPDYGDYYYADGDRRLDVMEVAFDITNLSHS